MAWYYGTYQCGHDGRVDVIGKMSERPYRIDREFSKKCPDCRQKEREEEIQKKNEESKKFSHEHGLIELNGSEKQVSWATTLRYEFIKAWEEMRAKVIEEIEIMRDKHPEEVKETEKNLPILDKHFEHILKSKDQASYWIDNRAERAVTMIWDSINSEKSN